MSVIHFEEMKIRQQEIEVRALIAIKDCPIFGMKAQKKLRAIAFPERLAEELSGQTEWKEFE